MAEVEEHESKLTRAAGGLFERAEHGVYMALGLLLALAAVFTLVETAAGLFKTFVAMSGAGDILDSVDRLLFVLMMIEILHTVRVSMRSGTLSCEPFLIVGLIASIRRVLVITLKSSEVTKGDAWTPAQEAVFRASMIELGVLAALILTMVVSIFLLHRARPGGEIAGTDA